MVIKIQYPEARDIFPVDLAIVQRVATLVQRMQSRIDIRTLVEEVTRFIGMELDFRISRCARPHNERHNRTRGDRKLNRSTE